MKTKQIIIPEGHNARIEGDKIIIEPNESTEEKIKKWLIDLVEKLKRANPYGSYDGLSASQILDWIKRQKEQKPLSTEETELNSITFLEQMGYTCIPKESRLNNSHNGPDFKKAVNDLRIVACLFTNWKDEPSRKTNDGKLIVDVDAVETIINANHIIQESDVFDWDQAYQKGLNHGKIAGYNKAMKEHKSAEWSEKDEEMVECLVRDVKMLYGDINVSDKKEIVWLKSLRPQPKQEWSVEDENYFQNLIIAVDSTFGEGNTKNWLQNRFKSLSERSK